jgi:hypothetical protein
MGFLEVLVLLVAGTVDVGSRTTSYYALYIILNKTIKLWGSEDMLGRSSLTCRPRAIGRTSVRPKVNSTMNCLLYTHQDEHGQNPKPTTRSSCFP